MASNILETLVTGIATSLENKDVNTAVKDIELALKQAIQNPGLLPAECLSGSPDGYKRHLLHVNADSPFTIMSLVWLPGQESPVHGHQAWCVVGIAEGTLTTESFTRRSDGNLECIASSTAQPGETCIELPGNGDIHRLANRSNSKAVSLHIYGMDLSENACRINECHEYKDCA